MTDVSKIWTPDGKLAELHICSLANKRIIGNLKKKDSVLD